jgi:hypothetical protein
MLFTEIRVPFGGLTSNALNRYADFFEIALGDVMLPLWVPKRKCQGRATIRLTVGPPRLRYLRNVRCQRATGRIASIGLAAQILRALSCARLAILTVALTYALSVLVGMAMVHSGNGFALAQRASLIARATART